jgi:curved DNA-binding protein
MHPTELRQPLAFDFKAGGHTGRLGGVGAAVVSGRCLTAVAAGVIMGARTRRKAWTWMQYRDYYEILGVSRDASDKEIRQAYRRLARQYHPDKNPTDAAAEERFKEINEANEVLTDPEKRHKYDLLGASWQQWQGIGHNPQDFDFARWFSGDPRPARAAGTGGMDRTTTSQPGEFSDFYQSIFGGTGAPPGTHWRQARARTRRGRDYQQVVSISLEEAYHGTRRVLEVNGARLEAKIPAGSRTGLRIRLAGKGGPGIGSAPAGDLLLDIQVARHAVFTRKEDDLYCQVPVDLYTAVLGGEVRVSTLKDAVRLRIPPGTQPGSSFRLRGQGMPILQDSERHGDLFVQVQVGVPQELSEREKALFEELAAIRR